MTFDETLVHFGVKGMKWGVRKERTSAEKKALAKKVAIGTGVLLVAAGAAAVTYQLNKNGKLPMKDVSALAKQGKKAADAVLKEQTDVVHATRGKYKGFQFLKKGGVPDPLAIYEEAFGADSAERGNIFRKMANGKIAATFADPKDRLDFAGRPIRHQVLIPKSMTDGVDNIDDVKSKIWPVLKDAYDAFYESSKNKL